MPDIAAAKDALRARMREIRKAVPAEERADIDSRIAQGVFGLAAYQEADIVFTYLSMGAEVDTRAIIRNAWAAGKDVALPRCTGPRTMRWFCVESFDGLQKSSFGVEEPAIDESRERTPSEGMRAVAIVPGMTFDDEGYRLGYGGGFYDTFLAEFPGASIGLCRSAQRVCSLTELGVIGEYDLPVDFVVCEAS